jgi:hypothetical protein
VANSPGRITDGLIARRLLKAVVIHNSVTGESHLIGSGLDRQSIALPHYSTDVDDAYRIVGIMLGRGFTLKINNITSGEPYWLACFIRSDGREYLYERAETMAMAICEAALAALDNRNIKFK